MEESKPKLNLLENLNLLELTTLIYAFLTFLCYSYIDTYFKHWGINIYSYLDASEILLVIYNNINYLVAIVIVVASIYFGTLFFYNPAKVASKLNQISNTDNASSTDIRFNKMLIMIGILIFGELMLYVIYLFDRNVNSFELYFKIYFSYFSYLLSLYIFIPLLSQRRNISVNFKIANIILIIIASYNINSHCANFKFSNIKDKKEETNFNFKYELVKYQSNDSLLYIGATSKYIFIRNTKSKCNLIFEKSNIKNLSLVEEQNKPK